VPANNKISDAVRSSSMTRDISIWLDRYEEIFSDFDSRPYSDRILSDDFISELQKVCDESEFAVNELKLLLPDKMRDHDTETVINKKLHGYLRKNFHYYLTQRKKVIVRGLIKFISGTLLIAMAFYALKIESNSISITLLFVMIEPPGWFLVWTGLEELNQSWIKKSFGLDFYSKMHKCKISFVSR